MSEEPPKNDLQHQRHAQLVELGPRLRRFACALSGSIDAGEELVQAACERYLQRQSKLGPDTRLAAWMYRVIRNLHLDSMRAQSVRERATRTLLHETAEVPAGALDNHLALDEVLAAMQKLSVDHRAALMLIGVEGVSYQEAADILEVPLGTVTSRLVRARQALLKKLGHSDVDPFD